MHELQLLLGSIARLVWEGTPLHLRQDAGVADLLHVFDAQYAPHHLLAAELLQGFEVKVPEALMPTPSLVVAGSQRG